MRLGQRAPGKCIILIQPNGLLEKQAALLDGVLLMLVDQISPLEGELPGFGVLRALSGKVGLLTFGQLDLKGRDDLLSNIVLQGEYVADLAIIAPSPEVAPCRGLDQLCCHAHPLAATAYTAFQHVLDA